MDELFPIDGSHLCLYTHTHTHNSLLLNFQSSFLFSSPLTSVSCQCFFPPLFVSPLLLLHLASYLIPLQSLYSPIPHPLASNSPMRITKPARRHLYIHLSISPFLLFPAFSPFPFFSLFSLRAKGKLAASFSLPKGLFKLETLQSPHPPPPPLSFLFLYLIRFRTSFSWLGVTPTFPR